MTFFFWLALVVGGGLFLLSLAGNILGIADHGAEAFHADVDTGGDTSGDNEWGRVFSLRNATYFLFGFGAVGVLLDLLWGGQHQYVMLILALLTGTSAWALSHSAFAYLRRTDSGASAGDQQLIGRVGEVSLPILKGGTGKILVERAGQTQELLAKPLDDSEASPESWSSVIVVDVSDGVALVSPYPEDDSERA